MASDEKKNGTARVVNADPEARGRGRPPLPVDRGWAWMVLFGATFNILLLMMFIRSTALLFIYFLDMYKASATMTTLVFALSAATFSISNIVSATVLVPRFQVRSVAVTGAFLMFFSVVGIAFAPSIGVVNFFFAILGAANGLIVVPQLTLIGHYFKRRLALSTSLTTLGVSLATIASTPITQMLIDEFGVRGAVLLLGGLTLHCVPASMLFRPLSFYSAPLPDDDVKEPKADEVKLKPLSHANGEEGLTGDNDECREALLTEIPLADTSPRLNGHALTVQDAGVKGEHEIDNNTAYTELAQVKPQPRSRSVSESGHSPRKDNATRESVGSDHNLSIQNGNDQTSGSPRIRHSFSAAMSTSLKYLDDQTVTTARSLSQADVHDSNPPSPRAQSVYRDNKRTGLIGRLKQAASTSIFFHPVGVLLLLASGFGIHIQAGLSYMPVLGVENGLSDEQVPYVMTAIGISDLISKLSVGFLADSGYFHPALIACVTQLATGLLFQFIFLFKGMLLMMVLQGVLGLTVGVLHVLLPAITVKALGVEHMGRIVAGYMLINGFTNAIDHFVIGTLKDLTGAFSSAYNFMGASTLLSAGLLFMVPFMSRCSKPPKAEG